jgi:hypothetical protein
MKTSKHILFFNQISISYIGKVSGKNVSGKGCILNKLQEGSLLLQDEILVADITNPDWNPILNFSPLSEHSY